MAMAKRDGKESWGAGYLALMHLLSRYTAITLRGVTGKSKMVPPPVNKTLASYNVSLMLCWYIPWVGHITI